MNTKEAVGVAFSNWHHLLQNVLLQLKLETLRKSYFAFKASLEWMTNVTIVFARQSRKSSTINAKKFS